jgi:UDP-N-acetylmuramate: L-alanyl-gamma-D-glutamyl-meso-diaminopimelate ligase
MDQQLDVRAVVDAIRQRGIQADAFPDVESIQRRLVDGTRPGDVLLIMSNGAFGGLIPNLLTSIAQ